MQRRELLHNPSKTPPTSTMSKQTIQSSDEKVWSDVESNTITVSDDDALMKATGKVGELKRYDSPPYL
jgi:hypothetical protein